jgi:hypothetical protein
MNDANMYAKGSKCANANVRQPLLTGSIAKKHDFAAVLPRFLGSGQLHPPVWAKNTVPLTA